MTSVKGLVAATYGVAYNFSPGDATVPLPAGTRPQSMRVTNTAYAAPTMLDGDPNGFARKFDTAHRDFFLLTIEGLNAVGALTGSVTLPTRRRTSPGTI